MHGISPSAFDFSIYFGYSIHHVTLHKNTFYYTLEILETERRRCYETILNALLWIRTSCVLAYHASTCIFKPTRYAEAWLKLTWTVIYHCRRQPYFFWRIFIWNRVLARCMSWLISFALASSSCKERKRGLQNEKFFLPTAGIELTTSRLWSHRLNR